MAAGRVMAATPRPRVGVCILPEHPWAVARRMWQHAEDYGFDHAWTYDHMTWSRLPHWPWYAAMPTLAAAATATSRIQLGTFVSSPNNHHPVQFIREILALHDISAGRFLLGVGAGGDVDAVVTGTSGALGQRTARFREFTELLDELLRRDGVTWSGSYFAATSAGSQPGPVNDEASSGVPLLVAANGPRGIRLAVERGDGWVTYGAKADDETAWWAAVGEAARRADAEVARQSRVRPLPRYLGLDSVPDYPLQSIGCFEDALGRATQLGFTDVVVTWPRPAQPYAASEAVLDEVAVRVLSRPVLPGDAPGRSLARSCEWFEG